LDMIQGRSDPEKRTWLICRGMNDVGTTGTDEAVEICGSCNGTTETLRTSP
jgi:hypothetical protein